MSKAVATRKSTRLKKNQTPNYVFRNYLRQAIHIQRNVKVMLNKMDEHAKVKKPITRQEVQAVIAKNRKYDDIFSSVVDQAEKLAEPTTSAPIPAKKRRIEEPEPILEPILEPEASEDDIEVLEVFACSCGSEFDNHAECHSHIVTQHDDTEFDVKCRSCGVRFGECRTRHLCHICGSFAEDLNAHIAQHYQNCTSKSAVMECRFCVKQFLTVAEVVEHEKLKHTQNTYKKPVQYYKCNDCSFVCTNPDALTVHYNTHLNVNLLTERIEELQYKVAAVKEECPFCRTHIGTRKTFRSHILKQHYPAAKALVSANVLDELAVKKEVNEIVQAAEALDVVVKVEVKEEVEDDGYPGC